MTILAFDLKSPGVSSPAVAGSVANLCLHVCQVVLAHLQNEVLGHHPSLRSEVKSLGDDLLTHLVDIRQAMPDRTVSVCPITVQAIHVEKRFNRKLPELNFSFDLEDLSQVYPKVLTEMVDRLLDYNLTMALPQIQLMRNSQRRSCINVLSTTPKLLANVLDEYLDDRGIPLRSYRKSSSFNVIVRAEFHGITPAPDAKQSDDPKLRDQGRTSHSQKRKADRAHDESSPLSE